MPSSPDKMRLGVVGVGNMGGSLIHGLIDSGCAATGIHAVDLREEALAPLAERGVKTSTELVDAVDGCDLVVLGLKPQFADSVLVSLGNLIANQILLSVMAGVTTATIEARIGGDVVVVRAMPQTVVRLQAGATAVCAGSRARVNDVAIVRRLFDRVGSTVEVTEVQMDAVTGLSGSGPAYVYTVIEALADGGVKVGLARDVALRLAAQTVAGAARMVLGTDKHPAALRDEVTSPGGTTIAGLSALEEEGLRHALISAVEAATIRSREIGQAGRDK
ncbi:MAG: pyrroline-5-carboxylate reductase [Candidatus Latescibacterota bacterium]|nr:pyrroline-5-carboxylate reductase [Candidatus Latescibacterota bacterium]